MPTHILMQSYHTTPVEFHHYWLPSPTNLEDCVTKHHASVYHRSVQVTFLATKGKIDLLKKINLSLNCAGILKGSITDIKAEQNPNYYNKSVARMC